MDFAAVDFINLKVIINIAIKLIVLETTIPFPRNRNNWFGMLALSLQ